MRASAGEVVGAGPGGCTCGPVNILDLDQSLTIDVTLVSRSVLFMHSKLIYWIPIVGVFVTLAHYDKDNGMGAFWGYYQAAMLVIIIGIIAILQTS